ncbi:threonylcarbamoyl-AMP synthase [Candidatus Falkowbacteria bacterium RIFOXYB2_FULL_38_15]|uniref:Threonylcarbamoyl-AMP synthase n=1 Tax=Candidatus Falkowbacteria bacterium RIFOXYA2_FULL_38_12 TaxID=1797993 RepID=A0A1F5S212_9BACT|nr:MAG: threonylcarbamoyl-AMP synthase [Candidatus Falkowbacteria bacterium RIFOXYA2_FULL_38_12]OGF32545.1 MAG: threonylcarbamoyl-AMP synthase [Candidatus Falkowbacteria bacterium RIFOXYB2_FULL_38_15]OGF41989.1 MAG: threonylcarbamoyl-AMP synthase [Candidatus Falkowbacteria bacterium RIFOXYD2_FULL_39_16]
MTEIIRINPKKPEDEKIKKAAQILRNGGLVAFPTETVYGLGADALNPMAIKKIFKAKKRPQDNPLILHIAEKEDIFIYTEPDKKNLELIKKLINKFWPGPLTLIIKKKKIVPEEITAGLKNTSIRLPDNIVARALIKKLGSPIAAPSANLSGSPSPTEASHVYNDLAGRIEMILDGGETKIGVESTILDCTKSPFVLLRPGKITAEELEKIVGTIKIHKASQKIKNPPSPGLKYAHYSPKAKLILVEGNVSDVRRKIDELIGKYGARKVGVLNLGNRYNYKNVDTIIYLGENNEAIAKNLFKSFRDFDKKNIDIILVEGIPEKNFGAAIMNRMRKAAKKIIKV